MPSEQEAHARGDEPAYVQESGPSLRITKGRPWRVDHERQRSWTRVDFMRKHVEEVVQLGNPVLRTKAKKIRAFGPWLEELAAGLYVSMVDAGGLGIAAPQIGVPLRVAVLNAENLGLVAVNPQIMWQSERERRIPEACLSLRGFQGYVWRPTKVRGKALDIKGKEFRFEGVGVGAQLLVHEFDHLNGTLYAQRLESLDDLYVIDRDGDTEKDSALSPADRRRFLRDLQASGADATD